jgi:glycosyltransferase involved in cell wall biosynthesis
MKIIFVMHYAGSPKYGMAYRPHYLAREWVKQGHKVTMVAASFSHLRMLQPEVNEDLQTEDIDGINYLWLKTPEYHTTSKRVINIYVFVNKLKKYAKKIAEIYKPDLVIASSCYPFDIYPCRKIANYSKAKLCFEVHDLWPLTPMLVGGYSKWNPYIMSMQKAENVAYSSADFVNSLLWNSETHARKHGLAPGKFQCVPNGYTKEEWQDINLDDIPEEHFKLFNKLRAEQKLIIGYAGSYAPAQYLETLLSAAKLLLDSPSIHIVFVGKGPKYNDYMEMIRRNALTNVSILPAVGKKTVPNIVANFDVCYMGGGHSVLHQYGTSFNKEIDYLLSGKPVIKAIDEPGSLVERINCGFQTEAENAKQVADAILKFASMTDVERTEMGMRGKRYAEDNLEWSILAKRFLEPFK